MITCVYVDFILLYNAANSESQQTQHQNEIETQRAKVKVGETD